MVLGSNVTTKDPVGGLDLRLLDELLAGIARQTHNSSVERPGPTSEGQLLGRSCRLRFRRSRCSRRCLAT